MLTRAASFLILAGALVVPVVGHAEVAPPEHADDTELDAMVEALALEEVVIVGSRTETPLAESSARVEVITRDEIERSGARDASELLEEHPSVLVTRSFRGAALQLGGLDPEYTLVLVDGERVPGRIGGAIDLARFGVENLERIEILRGPGSALYGSDAIAGVVNLITRPPSEGFRANATTSYGYGMGHVVDGTGGVSGTIGKWSARLTGGYHYSDPFRRNEATEATAGSGREQWSVGGRVDYRPFSGMRVDARVDYLIRDFFGVDENVNGAIFDRRQRGEQLQVSIGESYRSAGGTTLTARMSYSLFREQYVNDQRGGTALDDVQDNREHMGTGILQLDHSFGTHRVSVGFEGLLQTLDSARLETPGQRARYSLYAQDDWTIVENEDVLLVAVLGSRFDLDTQFGFNASPRAGLRFDAVRDTLIFRASYGLGFRAPSFQELLLRFENPTVGYIVAGNPVLKPESSRGLDIGAEWRATEWLTAQAYFFRNDLDDMIGTVTLDESVLGTMFSYGNIARAYTQGVDSSVLVKPLEWLQVRAAYTFLNTRDVELKRPLEGRPAHRATLTASMNERETGISATVRTALLGPRTFFTDTNGDGIEERYDDPSVVQCDLRLAKDLFEHVEVFVGIDNVFDVGDAYLFARPRTFYGGVRGRL